MSNKKISNFPIDFTAHVLYNVSRKEQNQKKKGKPK